MKKTAKNTLTALTVGIALLLTGCGSTIEAENPNLEEMFDLESQPTPTPTSDTAYLIEKKLAADRAERNKKEEEEKKKEEKKEKSEKEKSEKKEETRKLPSDKKKLLDALKVAPHKDDGNYERPDTWKSASRYSVDAPQGNCTVRQAILYRDGKNVEINDNCQPYKGSWVDPYTNTKYGVGGASGEPTDIGNLHIDHIVPMKNAYVSGAHAFTDYTFLTFAHDVNNLIVAEGSGNTSKGDKGPESWKPDNKDFHCEYASSWIDVKTDWELSITESEKSALSEMLATC